MRISALYTMTMFDRNLWVQAKQQLVPLAATIGFGVLLGLVVVGQAWVVSGVISDVFLDQKPLNDVQRQIFWLIAVVAARAVAVYGKDYYAGMVSIRVRSKLRIDLVHHLLRLSPIQVSKERAGELTNTVVEGIDRLDAYFRAYLPQLVLAVILPLLILVVVFPLDLLTGLIFLLTAPLIPLFMVLVGKAAEKETERQWKLLGRLSGHFYEVLGGLRILKAYGLSKRQSKVIQSVSEQYSVVTLKVLRIAFLSALTLEILATISTAVIAVQIGLRLIYGLFSFRSALFILILAPEFYFPLRQLGAAFHAGMEGISAAERIFGIIDLKSLQHVGGAGIKGEFDLRGDIRFEGVSFAYEDGKRPSLLDVSFTIPWGKKTALIGPSGSGKSTILNLLMGFIEPDSGRIWVDNLPFDQIPLEAWRQHAAWIPQFPALFNRTVDENIRISKPGANAAQVEAAVMKANAHEFISGLPRGFKTMIGEKGAKISGGQGQRLALARAFLKDSPMLLMDEPTTHLDIQNELRLKDSLQELLRDRTVLMIAHRLESILSADHIIVLEEGRVVQTGSPDVLMNTPGQYRDMILAGVHP